MKPTIENTSHTNHSVPVASFRSWRSITTQASIMITIITVCFLAYIVPGAPTPIAPDPELTVWSSRVFLNLNEP